MLLKDCLVASWCCGLVWKNEVGSRGDWVGSTKLPASTVLQPAWLGKHRAELTADVPDPGQVGAWCSGTQWVGGDYLSPHGALTDSQWAAVYARGS